METAPVNHPPQEQPVAFTGCCPRFDPRPYQDKQIELRDELFVREHVISLFHVPLNMGKRILHAKGLIDAAGAQPAVPLMLSDDRSPWGADLYIQVSKPVPSAEVVKLPGTYLTKVFEGAYGNAPNWARAMREYVAARGRHLERLYFAYTTCPSCAKVYGENYVVLFAKVG